LLCSIKAFIFSLYPSTLFWISAYSCFDNFLAPPSRTLIFCSRFCLSSSTIRWISYSVSPSWTLPNIDFRQPISHRESKYPHKQQTPNISNEKNSGAWAIQERTAGYCSRGLVGKGSDYAP
jgi:hypothetical protein